MEGIWILLVIGVLVLVYINQKDQAKELDKLILAADNGDEEAEEILSEKFDGQLWTEKLAEARKRIYLPMAEKGDSFAQYQMGVYYWVTKDEPEQAEKWFAESANNGNKDAMWNLINGYDEYFNNSDDKPRGFGFEPEKRQKWLLKAASAGDSKSMYTLGWENYIEKNYNFALEWFERALCSNDCHIRMETLMKMSQIHSNILNEEFYDVNKSKALLIEALRQKYNPDIDESTYDRDDFSDAVSDLGRLYEGEYYKSHDDKDLRNAMYCFLLAYCTGDDYGKDAMSRLPYIVTEAEKNLWMADAHSQVLHLPYCE